jgi:hypothetical protein
MIAILLCILSCIQIISGSAKYELLGQKQHLQDFLDKKVPFVVEKQPYMFQQQSFGKVISIKSVSNIEYLDNHLIGMTMDTAQHSVLDLCSNEQLECSKPFMKVRCAMPMPAKTEMVLNWGAEHCANIRVSRCFTYGKSSSHEFDTESSFIPFYRDENQPPLVWVKNGPYCFKNNYCSSMEPHYNVNDHKAVFESPSYLDECVSQCKEKGITLYDYKQLVFKYCDKYDCEQIYCYAPDKSFAVYCLLFMDTEKYLNQCHIVYSDQNDVKMIPLKYKEDFVVPRSIAMNPVSNSFALLLADGTIQYWNSKGDLLATQAFSTRSKFFPSFGNYCSFSPNGMCLAAIYKKHIIESNVPFRVRAQIIPEKLTFILFCLKHQQILPKDIVYALFNIFKS